jgi:hypothetical protein
MRKPTRTRVASKPSVTIKENEAVPFVITKTTLKREPKLRRKSTFIGVRAGLTRLAYALATKAIEIAEEAFFDKEMEVDDGGVLAQKHYAVFVNEDGYGPTLTVEEVPWKPACGAHYEIIGLQKDIPPIPDAAPPKQTNEQTEATRLRLAAMMDEVRSEPVEAPQAPQNGALDPAESSA